MSVMQFVPPPNQILRYALIQGLRISSFATHVGSFIATTLFESSALALDGGTYVQLGPIEYHVSQLHYY